MQRNLNRRGTTQRKSTGFHRLTKIFRSPSLRAMVKYTPPPVTIIQQIRDMAAKTAIYSGKTPNSVKSLVSRVREQCPQREYRTAKKGKGTMIYRDK